MAKKTTSAPVTRVSGAETARLAAEAKAVADAEAKQEALRCLRCDKFGLGALKQGGQLPW